MGFRPIWFLAAACVFAAMLFIAVVSGLESRNAEKQANEIFFFKNQ